MFPEVLESEGVPLQILKQGSKGGTLKLLIKFEDGAMAEYAALIYKKRKIVCLSSRTGKCGRSCGFCATGTICEGKSRNITWAETLAVFFLIIKLASWLFTDKILASFMGQNEAMANATNTCNAIFMLSAHENFSFAVSTIGQKENLIEFIKLVKSMGLKVKIQFSLHFPDQRVRQKHMPATKGNSLKDILNILEAYYKETGMEICVNYALFKELNCRINDFILLRRLLKGRDGFYVKFSEANTFYNPYTKILYAPSEGIFYAIGGRILSAAGIKNKEFHSVNDIEGVACGMMTSLYSE